MLRSRTAAWRRLEASTAARVAASLAAWGGTWVAWSGGKDSTAVADLAHRARPGIPVVHFDCGLDFPENTAYMAQIAESRGWRYEPLRTGDGLAALAAAGTWGHDHAEGHPDAPRLWWDAITGGPSALAHARFGDRMLIGLHHDESGKRARALARASGHAVLAGGLRSWAPIGHWDTAAVWAYHRARGIPENPVYTRLREMGAPEKSLRLDLVIGADGLGYGRIMWLRRGWPDLYERYAAVLPRLREFA